MTTYIIKVILDNRVVQTIRCDAVCQSRAEDLAFAWADSILGAEKSQDVELFFINNPRHQVLFQGVN
jgi:hypothetical protein